MHLSDGWHNLKPDIIDDNTLQIEIQVPLWRQIKGHVNIRNGYYVLSKRSYEQKLACNIKNDSKSFYAYVRSKQNVQDKVGPLEDSAGNIISRVFNSGRPKWLLQFSVYQRRY